VNPNDAEKLHFGYDDFFDSRVNKSKIKIIVHSSFLIFRGVPWFRVKNSLLLTWTMYIRTFNVIEVVANIDFPNKIA
jgi:hypothetical protein